MNPFIPLKEANLAIVAGNADREIFFNLEKLGIKVVRTIKCEELYDSVAYHPDMVIHPLDHKSLLIAPNVYAYYREKLSKYNLNIIKGERVLASKYPENIAYNIGRLSKVALHHGKYTDNKALKFFEKNNIELIKVKQGYSKCSMAIIDHDMAISSDKGICKKLEALNYPFLLIEAGYISLEKEKYGFIGGATGSFSKDKVFFTGTFEDHPDEKKIKKFLRENKKEIVYLSRKKISDIGTIISLHPG